ncbi:MAG TPA: hypothetical protein PK569_04410 [Thermoanaerobaculia bacterium]|jgi:hypothetical protein|nr:hypothetical protein [Thermoanaerobaculia bacterium]HQN06794.1 hypothetical protein [Thermoanaerobaculia bacterium]
MPHELKTSPDEMELLVTSPDREGLFRDALAGALEAVYGAPLPEGENQGQVVPVQASAGDDESLLVELVHDVLRAVRAVDGALRPPRWLAFDDRRVTANLPVHLPKVDVRLLQVSGAAVETGDGGWFARIELLPRVEA